MSYERHTPPRSGDCFKEAVCVNASRIYDACRDRDCLADLPVYFVEQDKDIVSTASSVKLKYAEVLDVNIDTEPVPFNKGYYCVDITMYIGLKFDVSVSPVSSPCEVCGLCVAAKKAVLFGSEGGVKIFSSDCGSDKNDTQEQSCGGLPTVTCQIAEPVCLGSRLRNVCESAPCCIPPYIARRFSGSFSGTQSGRGVCVTLGIFMIIQLERQVQMLMPAYDFCMPEKVCVEQRESDPCEMFSRMSFPTDAFFPPRTIASPDGCQKK